MRRKHKTRPIPLEQWYHLVLIHWVDSSSRRGVWNPIEELQQGAVNLACVSVGFVLHEDTKNITLAAHITPQQAGGDLTIPQCAITRRQTIGTKGRQS